MILVLFYSRFGSISIIFYTCYIFIIDLTYGLFSSTFAYKNRLLLIIIDVNITYRHIASVKTP